MKPEKVSWKSPEGMSQDLVKIFEKRRLGERAILCLWVNVQLNSASELKFTMDITVGRYLNYGLTVLGS